MSGASFGVGDTVQVRNSDYRNGLVRKVTKMHHSGRYAYLEPGHNEHGAELYFHISKLVRVTPQQLSSIKHTAVREDAIEITRERLAHLFTKEGVTVVSPTHMRPEAESIVRSLDAAGCIV